MLYSEDVPEELNDPTGECQYGEEERVTDVVVLSPAPDLLHVVRLTPVDRHGVLVVANVRSSYGHGTPHKLLNGVRTLFGYFTVIKERSSHYIVVGQLQFELRGGAEPSEEHVLQVDEGRPEGAVVEGGHQGPGEHVRRAAQEGGENVERVECGGEVPLAGGVPDGNAVHNVPDQSVVNVGGDHFVVFVWNVDHH